VKNSEKNSINKLNIVNFKKIEGKIFPEIVNRNSYTFILEVLDSMETDETYILKVKYGSDTYNEATIKIKRTPTPLHLTRDEIYEMDIHLDKLDIKHSFEFYKFKTPHVFMRELRAVISKSVDYLPF
jgi:hypothetical protein